MKQYQVFSIIFILIVMVSTSCTKGNSFKLTAADAEKSLYCNSDQFLSLAPGKYHIKEMDDNLLVDMQFLVTTEGFWGEDNVLKSFSFVPLDNRYKELSENIVFQAVDGVNKLIEMSESNPNSKVSVEFVYHPTDQVQKERILTETYSCQVFLELNEVVNYDKLMDMYVEAARLGDFEVIAAVTENIFEAQMNGLLTPQQENRWNNIDALEVNGSQNRRH